MAPQLWDAVRFAVDRGHERGGFILTGSSTPRKRPAHSGIGCIASLNMSTITLFESLCVHDLRVYADALGGGVFHYRDKTGLEADVVIHLHDGRWAPVEVKLGNRLVDDAAKHLLKLASRVDQERKGAPSFLMVLTATQAAYLRDVGVIVAPLEALAP